MHLIQSLLLLIFVVQSSSETVNRAKRAAIEPFQPLVGAPFAKATNSTKIENATDDPIGQGVHSGALKIAILVAVVIGAGVLLTVCVTWYFTPKDESPERSPLLNGAKRDDRCPSEK